MAKPECCGSKWWETFWFVSQIIMIILYCTCCTFEDGMRSHTNDSAQLKADNAAATENIRTFYPMWMDIHVMIFVGFGFLMVFLKTHSWSSIGLNYLCAAWAMQCGMIMQGFWHCVLVGNFDHKINISLNSLIEGEFCAGTFLITMGALLGKATFPQLMLLATFESFFWALNGIILLEKLHVHDIGGAMTIHMFGAYFGLAATYFFENKKAMGHKQNGGSYQSQLIAMVGTLFLFMYWPSFNAVLCSGMGQQRAVVNTVLSITASTLSSVYVSRIYLGKIDMEVLLNSTLAGGVMMGAGGDLITVPGFAMLAGAICGIVSACGFLYFNELCQKKLQLHDTCGVQWLHGVPGTLGSILTAIAVACAGYNFENDTVIASIFGEYPDRSLNTQAGYQLAGMAITWGIAIPAGALFGFIASRLPMPAKQFDDDPNFMHVEYGDDTAQFNSSHGANT